MSLKAGAKMAGGSSSGAKSPPLEPDNYPGRLVQVIDLGLQPQRAFQGKEKPPAYQIMTTYELVTEFLENEDGTPMEDKPRWLSETFPLYSLSADRATSTARYNALDPKHLHDGDWSEVVNAPCLVQVVTYEKDGGTKNAVGSTAPPVKGMQVPPLVNPTRVFSLDDPDLDVFKELPDWLQDKIRSNLEYEGSRLQALLDGGAAPTQAESEEDYDDIPV